MWHGALQFTNTAIRALDEALVAAHGISVKEFDVLITLFNAPNGKLRMTELGERVVLSASGVSHLVTRLERDGPCAAAPTPRTVAASSRNSTRAGHRRLHDSRPTHNAVVRAQLTGRVTATQLSRLGDLWEAILGPWPAEDLNPTATP